MSSKRTYAFSLLLTVLVLSGCAGTLPPLSFSAPNIGLSSHKIDAEIKSLTVTTARPDEATGEFAPGVGPETCTLWKTSLQEALDKMLIFKDDSPKKISLSSQLQNSWFKASFERIKLSSNPKSCLSLVFHSK